MLTSMFSVIRMNTVKTLYVSLDKDGKPYVRLNGFIQQGNRSIGINAVVFNGTAANLVKRMTGEENLAALVAGSDKLDKNGKKYIIVALPGSFGVEVYGDADIATDIDGVSISVVATKVDILFTPPVALPTATPEVLVDIPF